VSLEELTPEKEKRYLARLASLPLAKRFELTLGLTDTARAFMEAGIRKRYPDATNREIQARVAEQFCGREVAERLYGPFEKP
jgi:hypothetical protein